MKKMVTEHEAIEAANKLIRYCGQRVNCDGCKLKPMCKKFGKTRRFFICDYIEEEKEASPLARAMAASIMNRRD